MPRVKRSEPKDSEETVAPTRERRSYRKDMENQALTVTDAMGTHSFALSEYPEDVQIWLMLEGLMKRFSAGETIKETHDALMDSSILTKPEGRGRKVSLWRTAIINAVIESAKKRNREMGEDAVSALTDKVMTMSNADVQVRKSNADVRRHYRKLGGVLEDDDLLALAA